MKSKNELVAYFEEKSKRSENEGGAYFEAVNEMLILLEETDDIAEIKAFVRRLHRERLKEIQQAESIEMRIDLRKQLGVYDDLLTQIRTVH